MAATIDILTSGGSARYTAVLESASVRHFELMKEDYVRLVFKAPSNIGLDMGDKVTVDGTMYVITTPQNPTINKDTGAYEYDIQFDAFYWAYNNKLLKFIPESKRNEVSFSLTDNLEHHLSLVLRNIAAASGDTTAPAIGTIADADKNIYIHYDGLHIIDALTHICEAFNCEWWFEGSVLHIGKAQGTGTPIPLTLGVNVEDMGSEKGNRELVTRIYAFGSTRNIPFDYRSEDQEVTLNGVVQKRLLLPKETPYVQIQTVSDSNSVEGLVFFEDIYPRMDNEITDLDIDDREVETTQESAAGEETVLETVPIYRFKDSSLTFRESYVLAGQTLQVQFQSGLLNGMVFDLAFNPDGEPEVITENGTESINPDAQWFEIVRNDTYGLMLPNDVLKPAVGDEFVLLGWDVRNMESLGLIAAAEAELLTRAQAYLQTLQTDPNVYPCTMMADYMFGLDGSGHQDPAYSKVGAFPLGTPVTLSNGTLFQGGTRDSRVIGWEFKLDKPYDGAILYVGDTATYSSKKATSDSIQGVKNDVNYKLEGFGSGMNESQFSILLQSYGAKMFLSKTAEDVAAEKITFLKGIELGIGGAWGFVKQIVENGSTIVKAWFANLQADILQVLDHIKGPLLIKGNTVIAKDDNNQGGSLSVAGDTNINGKLTAANAEILNMLTTKNLTVTGLAHFFELVIDKIKAAGGAVLVTPANGFKVEKVESVSGGYKLYWSAEDEGNGSLNMWKEDDQAICQNFNGARVGTTFEEGNKYYWALVTLTSGKTPATVDGRRMHWIVISTSVCVGDPTKAEVGDEIAMLGYRGNDDTSRQSAIYLAAYNSLDSGLTAPILAFYKGINDFDLTSHRTTYIDANNAVFKGKFLSTSSSQEGIDIESLLSGSEFDIIYGFGNPNTVSPAPHATWTSPALKLLHVGTLYFDLDLEPASEGGRLYRWQKVETGAEYYFDGYAWVAISDIDTLSALDKIADVASDGKLTGGAEKVRVYLQWIEAKKTRDSLLAQADEKGLGQYADISDPEDCYKTGVTYQDAMSNLDDAFHRLSTYLNGKVNWIESEQPVPAWINGESLQVTQVLPPWTEKSEEYTTGPITYKALWDAYYDAVVEMTRALNAAQYKAIDEMGDDGLIDPAEKATLRQYFNDEVLTYYSLLDKEDDIYNKLSSDSKAALNTAQTAARRSLMNLGSFMNGATATKSGSNWVISDSDANRWALHSSMKNGLVDPAEGETVTNPYPLWLQKVRETLSEVVEDEAWDYFWKQETDARIAFDEAIKSAREEVTVDELTVKNVYTEFDDLVPSREHMTPGVMPSEVPFKVGDRWYEECALINPVTNEVVTKNGDNTQLYNIYVCHTAYTSDSVDYANRLNYWRLVSKPVAYISEANIEHIYDAIFDDRRFASFELRIDAIESVVSSLAASKNLLLNGDFSEVSSGTTLTHFSASTGCSLAKNTSQHSSDFNQSAALTINTGGTGRGLQMTTSDQPCLFLENGKKYTISVWAKSPTSGYVLKLYRGSTVLGDFTDVEGNSQTLATTFLRFRYVITGNGAASTLTLAPRTNTNGNVTGTFYFCGIQLEEGEGVSDWMAGENNSHVLSSYIRQTAEQIDLAVTKDGIRQSGITLNTNGCVIDGSKTTINGDLDVKGLTTENVTVVSHDHASPVVIDMSTIKSVMVSPLNVAMATAGPIDSPQLVVLPFWDSGYSSWSAGTAISFGSDGSFTLTGTKKVMPYKVAGTRLTITNAADNYCKNWNQLLDTGAWSAADVEYPANWAQGHCVIVCSDGRIVSDANRNANNAKFINPTSYQDSTTMYAPGVFYCNGYITRFIALLPAQTLQIRSQIMTIGSRSILVWMVENPSEFTPLTGKRLQLENNSGVVEMYFNNSPTADFSDARRGESECWMGSSVLLRATSPLVV